jgi:hypothetical protein
MVEEKRRVYKKGYDSLYRQTHKEEKNLNSKSTYQTSKKKVFDHYGWICSCCGESEPEFLTIDHIDGGGYQHKKETNGKLYPWLVRNNFPEGFRVLCYNCNCGRKTGPCPHEKETYLDRIGW